jgi:hypothetical protein
MAKGVSAMPARSSAMPTIDLKKTLKELYAPSATHMTIVDVPAMQFLMLDGMGDPNLAPEYAQAIEALYGVAYTLKFLLKHEQRLNYTVMPLEGLWRVPDMREFSTAQKEHWRWTMMIAQPDDVTLPLFARAVTQVQAKKELPMLAHMRLASFHEGLAAQIMYLGLYANEGPTIAALHAFIHEQGYVLDGVHHEIYLSDPRRVAPEKLRTVIRQPMRRE